MEGHEGRPSIQGGRGSIATRQLSDDHGRGFCAVSSWGGDAGEAGNHRGGVWAGDSVRWHEGPGGDGCDLRSQAGAQQAETASAGHMVCLCGSEEGVSLGPSACTVSGATEIWCPGALYPGAKTILHRLDGEGDAVSRYVLRHAGGGDGCPGGMSPVADALHPRDAGGVRAGRAAVGRGVVVPNVPGAPAPDREGEGGVQNGDVAEGVQCVGAAFHGRHVGGSRLSRESACESKHVRADWCGVWIRDACGDTWVRVEDKGVHGHGRGQPEGARSEPTGPGGRADGPVREIVQVPRLCLSRLPARGG